MGQSYNTCFIKRNKSCLTDTTDVVNLRPVSMGKRIEAERLAREWSQAKLAALVGNGLTQQAIDRLEKRDSDKSEHVVGLADALGVSLRWLITGLGRKDDLEWPFPRVQQARWDACDDVDPGYVQAAVNKALDDCEVNRRPFAAPEKRQVPAAA